MSNIPSNERFDGYCADCGKYGHKAISCPKPMTRHALQEEIEKLRAELAETTKDRDNLRDLLTNKGGMPSAGYADETKAPHEDKADLLSMAALVARKGRESLKADHKVEGEILLRAAEALHALSETRVTAPRSFTQETTACRCPGPLRAPFCPVHGDQALPVRQLGPNAAPVLGAEASGDRQASQKASTKP